MMMNPVPEDFFEKLWYHDAVEHCDLSHVSPNDDELEQLPKTIRELLLPLDGNDALVVVKKKDGTFTLRWSEDIFEGDIRETPVPEKIALALAAALLCPGMFGNELNALLV